MKHNIANAQTATSKRKRRFAPSFKKSISVGVAVTIAVATFTSSTAHAAGGLIRDAETESLIRVYASPIFQVAGLGSQGIKIHLVNNRSFNAFVVDGQNMFIHVGALMRAKTPNQLIGVIAHETGHIAGGHLARLRSHVARARSASLMLQILGIAAMAAGAIAGGSKDIGNAGAAVLYGGQTAAQRSILAYQRAEESSADQAAVTYLNATRQSAEGMLKTFEYFADQGLASLRYVDPYVQSHPMPQQRIVQLRELARTSPHFGKKDAPELQLRHDLMRAKIAGFLDRPQAVLNRYPKSDQSLPAHYARTITRYQHFKDLKGFLKGVNTLIKAMPNNPYFYELKGQFLLDAGKAKQAIPPLRKAIKLAPKASLIRILLSQALLSTRQPKLVDEAITHLRKAIVKENTSPDGYRLLANAYGSKGLTAQAQLASAHRYLYEGKFGLAKQQAKRAKGQFQRGTPNWIKADDIVNFQPPRIQ